MTTDESQLAAALARAFSPDDLVHADRYLSKRAVEAQTTLRRDAELVLRRLGAAVEAARTGPSSLPPADGEVLEIRVLAGLQILGWRDDRGEQYGHEPNMPPEGYYRTVEAVIAAADAAAMVTSCDCAPPVHFRGIARCIYSPRRRGSDRAASPSTPPPTTNGA